MPLLSDLDLKLLLDDPAQGFQIVGKKLYTLTLGLRRKYGAQLLRNEDLQDCVQETIEEIWQKIQNGQEKPINFQAWAVRILSCNIIDHLRKNPDVFDEFFSPQESEDEMTQNKIELVAAEESKIEPIILRKDNIERLYARINNHPRLSQQEKAVMLGCYFEGLAGREQAERLGIGEKHVNLLLHRAREKLRQDDEFLKLLGDL